MKKFFRVALVCALAGATLLYTSCTKDYSEDLHSLEKKVEQQGNSIATLEDQVTALQRSKTELEKGLDDANKAINTLKDRATALEKEVDTLKTEKARLEKLIADNAGDIASLKDSLAKVDSLLGVIGGQITTINGQIADLQETVKNHKTALDSIQVELDKKANKTYVDSEVERLLTEINKKANTADVTALANELRDAIGKKADTTVTDSLAAEIAKKAASADVDSLVAKLREEIALKADKTYVDGELAKKADQTWVVATLENYATTKALVDTAAKLRAALKVIDRQIFVIKGQITDLNNGLTALGSRVNDIADSVKINDQAIKAINQTIAGMQEDIDTLQSDMSTAKADIKKAQKTADSAAALAGDAMAFAKEVKQWVVDNYYDIATVNALLDKKLDIVAYKADTAVINQKIRDVDAKVEDVIVAYKAADETLQANIDTLEATILDLLGTKVDTADFEAYKKEVLAMFAAVETDINKLLSRVQSIVYVPDYDDNRITLNWAQVSRQSGFDTRFTDELGEIPASFPMTKADSTAWKEFFAALYPETEGATMSQAALMQAVYKVLASTGIMEMIGGGSVKPIKIPVFLTDDLKAKFGGDDDELEYLEYLMEVVATTATVSPEYATLMLLLEYGYMRNIGRQGTPLDLNGMSFFETPIPAPSHIKYRIYGADAKGAVEALVENPQALAFDVARVKTRAGADSVELNIIDAKVAEGDGSVIDLTVMPKNIPADFWFYTWFVKNYNNPVLHGSYLRDLIVELQGYIPADLFYWLLTQCIENVNLSGMMTRYMMGPEANDDVDGPGATLEENTDFPAFSVSLVLTDAEKNNFKASTYNNVVPAALSDKVELVIERHDTIISYSNYYKVERIEYSDLSKHTLFDDAVLKFRVNGSKPMTLEEFNKLGLNLGEPQARFLADIDTTGALDGKKLTWPYFVNKEVKEPKLVAEVNLNESHPEGVGAYEYVELTYFIGPARVNAGALVEVIPSQVAIEVDLGEAEVDGAATPFKWNYAANWELTGADPFVINVNDAKVDSAFYFGTGIDANALYFRDSAVAVYDATKVAKAFEHAGITIDAFKRAEPTTAKFAFVYDDETVDNVRLDSLGSYNGFTIAPFFEGEKVKAHVFNFPFFKATDEAKTAKGSTASLTEIRYEAVYSLVSGAVEATVTGKIKIDDRNRKPITITLPPTTEDIYVNYNSAISDSLFIGDAQNADITVATSLDDHHIAAVADVADAFGKVSSKTWTGLTPSSYGGETSQTRDILYGCANAAAGDPVNYQWVSGMGSDMEGGYAYLQNERIDSMTTTTRPITQAAAAEPKKALVRNNTTAHINTEFIADAKAGVKFNTVCNFNSRDLRNMEITPKVDYDFYLTLWYGQDVNVTKSYDLNVDGIFEYERINEYVDYKADDNVYTKLQPKWSPDYATTDFTIPVNGYEANKVLLNQHFRIVDVKRDTTCTELDGTIITPKYNYLRRRFWLEKENKGALVDSIADPRRSYVPTWKGVTENWGKNWAVTIVNPINAETQPNGEPNELSYYSMGDPTNVYADLYLVNGNGSFIKLGTRFDKPAANLIYATATDKKIAETYENYVIQLYDPLDTLTVPNDVKEININNSQVTVVSIYQFLSMKDKRGFELIDAENNGWVKGNVSPVAPYESVVEGEDPNGFENQYYANRIYNLHFTHTMAYISENVSPETKARITFDPETGLLRYQNDLQTQLAKPIDIQLTINVDYPWGHRDGAVTVRFYNKPVGE